MSGEIKLFKTSLIGGFDRHDVTEYVKALSAERNACREAQTAGLKEIERLNAALATEQAATVAARESTAAVRLEVDALRRELAEYRVAALETAERHLTELKQSYIELCGQMDDTVTLVRAQLAVLDSAALGVPTLFRDANDKIQALIVATGAVVDVVETEVVEVADAVVDAPETEVVSEAAVEVAETAGADVSDVSDVGEAE
ncbi:MAG: hypothetical protein LBN30_03265 [Oscillospiraceae bacterium]|jgi:hypothetical protein|nr:hypothetical protein [Oscillospiraceae bacterium]